MVGGAIFLVAPKSVGIAGYSDGRSVRGFSQKPDIDGELASGSLRGVNRNRWKKEHAPKFFRLGETLGPIAPSERVYGLASTGFG